MSEDRLFGPPGASLAHLLGDGLEFTPPQRALAGLDPALACRRPSGSPHSVAQILAHMLFGAERVLAFSKEEEPRRIPHASITWPQVSEEDWDDLVGNYLARLEEIRALTTEEAVLERPVRRGHLMTVGFLLTSHFAHDAHHLGQIILLRRQLGAWPPPGGGDTW